MSILSRHRQSERENDPGGIQDSERFKYKFTVVSYIDSEVEMR